MKALPRLLLSLILCALLVSLAPACSKGRDANLPPLPAIRLAQIKGTWADLDVQLQTSLPKVPQMMMVYRVVYPEVDADYVARIAKAFALDAEMQRNDNSLMVSEGQRALEVYPATGAFWFKDASALWSGKKPASLPSEAEGVKLAEEFLHANALLLKGMAIESTGHSNLAVYDVASGQRIAYDTDLHVNFRLTVEGVPVKGPGGKIKVYLGEESHPIGMYWAGFALAPYQAYPLISADEALSLLKENGIVTTVKEPRQVTIAEISLVYYAGPGLEAQEYLEPVYLLAGQVEGQEGAQPYEQYVPAIEGKYLKPLPIESDMAPSRKG